MSAECMSPKLRRPEERTKLCLGGSVAWGQLSSKERLVGGQAKTRVGFTSPWARREQRCRDKKRQGTW